MRKALPILILLFFSIYLSAQKTDEHYMPAQYTNSHCRVSFNKVFIGDSRDVKKVEEFLLRNVTNLAQNDVSIQLSYKNESPGGFHYSFIQKYKDVEVYQSEIKVNCDKQGNVVSVFDNSYDHLDISPDKLKVPGNIIFVKNGKAVFGEKKLGYDRNGILRFEELYEAIPALESIHYKFVFRRELNSYLVPDSLVTGYVYLPDPLTTAQAIYGGFYVDSSDADDAALTSQRVQVQFNANFDGTNFSLSNSYINMTDFDGPNVSPPVVTSPVFDFTRTQDSFEDVNVFYHLNVMRDYVHGLGFDAADFPVDVDAHALSNQDNSLFSPGPTPKRLYFGEGGVDDAEDADVIVHEYSHFLSYNAAPGSNVGGERQALDEGFGDYMAASYSRSISNYNWIAVYSWDGHNEYWNGRFVNVNRIYPQDLQGSIYRNGEMWASALMSLWEEIGRGATDSLILQAHYSYASNMNMDDAGYLMLQADTMLNNGAYYCPIYRNMYNRGFLPYYANNPCALSVDNEAIEGLGFWQNPAAFTITYEGDREQSFEIVDATGRIVESKTDITHNNFTYRAPNLANGLYFIVVAEGNARKAFKWIKQD